MKWAKTLFACVTRAFIRQFKQAVELEGNQPPKELCKWADMRVALASPDKVYNLPKDEAELVTTFTVNILALL